MREPLDDEGGYVPTPLDAEFAPDDVAAWAAAVTPGSAVAKPLALLDPPRLSPEARVDALLAMEKQIAFWQAQQYQLLAVMDAAPAASAAEKLDKHWVREDVAAALRLSGQTAAERLLLATELTRLPSTLGLLERGETTTLHARALAEAIVPLDDPTAATVERRVLAQASEQSVGTFRRAVHRAVQAEVPASVEEQHAQAMTERRIAVRPDSAGMGTVWALLPAEGAATVWTACDAVATRVDAEDPRTIEQRRADALVQICRDALHGTTNGGGLPVRHGLRPAIHVTVALSTLLGLDEQPGELDGHGPIPATLARRLAADPTGTWRRLVTDDLGKLLNYGRSTYRPPQDLTDHVIARDRTCRFPHCTRTARRCELDHQVPWESCGPTSEANLQALCSRHHHLKHETDWQTRRTDTGDTEWRSPTGHRYRQPAATYPIDRTTEADPDPPPF